MDSNDQYLKLWYYEVKRVFYDRMVDVKDRNELESIIQTVIDKNIKS